MPCKEDCIKTNPIIKTLDFWALGPVMPIVYDELKHYGSMQFVNKFSDYEKVLLKKEINENDINPSYEIRRMDIDNQDLRQIRNAFVYTIEKLKNKSTSDLVKMTHSKQSAWHYLYKKENRKC